MLAPAPLAGLSAVLALIAALFVWSLAGLPVLALASAAAGAYAPLAWARRTAVRARQERELAWPAALAQLADPLEPGIAFPAAVALLGEAGPPARQAEFTAFQARLRAAGLEAVLDGLAQAGERARTRWRCFCGRICRRAGWRRCCESCRKRAVREAASR